MICRALGLKEGDVSVLNDYEDADQKSAYAEHQFTTYIANENGTHTPSCACGKTKDAQACDYGDGETTDWSGVNPKTSKTCSVCEEVVVNDNVYYITSVDDLNAFATFVANGNTFLGKTLKLNASIDFNGETFSGIGVSTVQDYPINAFSGTFDGQNYEIKNLIIGRLNDGVAVGVNNTTSNVMWRVQQSMLRITLMLYVAIR